jgi:hypothetical protein
MNPCISSSGKVFLTNVTIECDYEHDKSMSLDAGKILKKWQLRKRWLM